MCLLKVSVLYDICVLTVGLRRERRRSSDSDSHSRSRNRDRGRRDREDSRRDREDSRRDKEDSRRDKEDSRRGSRRKAGIIKKSAEVQTLGELRMRARTMYRNLWSNR